MGYLGLAQELTWWGWLAPLSSRQTTQRPALLHVLYLAIRRRPLASQELYNMPTVS